MKVFRTLLLTLGLSLTLLLPVSPLVSNGVVKADSVLCDVFPFIKQIGFLNIDSICGTSTVPTPRTLVDQLIELGQFALSLIFVGIIIIAVYIIIKAAVKYIRSEGDETKIQEAQKAIKSAFVGLIALFVGIIGLVLILVIFDALGGLQQGQETPGIIDDILDPE